MNGFRYFDHAATTPVRPEVRAAMQPFFEQWWGNPSSVYALARQARRAMEEARDLVAEVLGCHADEIVFTSCGSESNNLAIKGVAMALRDRGDHIVTTSVEHHAVLHTCEWLEKHLGFRVTYLPVDEHGVVDLEALEGALTERTVLVSVMYANNEVGTVQPLREVVRLAKQRGVLVHTDAVQAPGSLDLDVGALGVDLLSLSGHKFYAPKGVGLLYVRRGTPLVPQLQGGSQERNRRAGTENVPYIVGMAKALELAVDEMPRVVPHLRRLRDRLLREVPSRVPGCRITGHPVERLPHNASFVFQGVEAEPVLLGLDRHGICASSGSACTSASMEPSHVLKAMGVPREFIYGSLRLTVGRENADEDVDRLLDVLPGLVEEARATSPLASPRPRGV